MTSNPGDSPPPGYYGFTRAEIVPLLEGRKERILEIGCSEGGTLAHLKEQGLCGWAGGVELAAEPARVAAGRIDQVWVANVEEWEPEIEAESLDAILCLDVLEHLVNPWRVLRRLVSLLRPNGIVIASLPNVRNRHVVLPLVLRGRWDYEPAGIMDWTHLRFFTRATATEMLVSAGLEVDAVVAAGKLRGIKKVVTQLTGGWAKDFYVRQFIIRGRRPPQYG